MLARSKLNIMESKISKALKNNKTKYFMTKKKALERLKVKEMVLKKLI